MASVDQRTVEMKFQNSAFQRGVADTMSALDKLKEKLGFSGATKGLEGVSKAAGNVKLGPMGQAADAVGRSFSAMQIAAVTAIATVVNKALTAGANIVKSLSIQPIMQGFSEYELKMGSIQTIMANTARHGTKLETVNSELNKLNTYADKTIYNFAEMTKNASLFTASGMKIEDATTVIKGFSNAAAASGTSAQGAAGAAYQLSQALNTGTIRLMDWKSLQNVGMGNKNMQDGLIQVASAMGTFNSETTSAEAAGKNFNGSLEKMWLSADVMSTYLKIMSGDMNIAQIEALGMDKATATALKAQAQTALEAATKVRTLTGLMGTLKEAVASGWAASFETIFGNFTEATELFTGVNDAIGGMLSRSGDARNKMLDEWKADGGRTAIIEGLRNAFHALMSALNPIREAFRTVFPATTGKQLADMSRQFQEFTEKLKMGEGTANNLMRTFRGVFSIFQIVLMPVKGLIGAFFDLFGAASAGGGGILAITAVIGDLIFGLQRILTHTDPIGKFFDVLVAPVALLKPLIALISALASALSALFTGDVAGFTSRFKEAFSAFGEAFDSIRSKINAFTNSISGAFTSLATMLGGLASRAAAGGNVVGAGIASGLATAARFLSAFAADARGTISNLISVFDSASNTGKTFLNGVGGNGVAVITSMNNSISTNFEKLKKSMDLSGAFQSFNSGASSAARGGAGELSTAGQALANAWDKVVSAFGKFGGGVSKLLSSLNGFFTTVIDKLRGYVKGLDMTDAVALLNTGVFIALYLTLKKFLSNLSDMVGSISGVFDQLTNTLKAMQQAVKAAIILQIAVAVGVLVAALFILAKIDGEALGKALIALTVVMTQMGVMLYALTAINPKSMMGAAAGMIMVASAIVILAGAVKILGSMDPEVLRQGAISLGIMMAALAAFSLIVNGVKGLFVAAAGLLILSVALAALAASIVLYAKIPFDVLEKGIGAMAATLLLLGLAMRAFPRNMIVQAVGITIMSKALVILGAVLAVLGLLPFSVLAKGIGAIAVSLGVLVIAARLMTGALPGAAAMIVMAGAIAILAPAVALLGQLDMKTIGKGLLALVGILAVIVVGMYALAPVVAVLALFAASIKVLSIAALLAATGFGIFVAALTALIAIGTAGFAVLGAGIITLINLFPLIAQQFGHAIIAFLAVLGTVVEKVANLAGRIFMAFVNEIAKRIPEIAQAGLRMIEGLLKAIRSKIYSITTLAIDIVVLFLAALSNRLGPIIQAGFNFIISFISGLAAAIRGNKQKTGEAGADLAKAIVEGMIAGLKAMFSLLPAQIRALALAAIVAFKQVLGINSPSTVFASMGGDIVRGAINGITNAAGNLFNKLREVATGAINAGKAVLGTAADIGRTMITNAVTAVATAAASLINKARDTVNQAIAAGKAVLGAASDIGRTMITNAVTAVATAAASFINKARDTVNQAIAAGKAVLGAASGIGSTMISNVVGAVGSAAGSLYTKARGAISGAVDAARGALGNADDVGRAMITAMVIAVGVAAGSLATKARGAISGALSSARGALGDADDIGRAMINGMIRGITGIAGTLASSVANAAKGALNAAKNVLGIKSPSREFMKVGQFAGEGMAIGIDSFAGIVAQTAEAVGDGAVRAIRESISNLGDAVSADVDMTPVIRPVMDLSDVQRGADRIGSLLTSQIVSVDSAIVSARAASAGLSSNQSAASESTVEAAPAANLTFVQNNNSPKALSAAEIYRQTQNQLSVVKGALTTNA